MVNGCGNAVAILSKPVDFYNIPHSSLLTKKRKVYVMNMNMDFERKLTIPMEVKKMYPLDDELRQIVTEREKQVQDIFAGKDDRIVLIIGPCSADREDSVLDYISRLRKVQDKVEDKIFIIPRIYTNKPRTTGAGYKGMLHQPDPEKKPDMFKGIVAIRSMHIRALKETGFSSFLTPARKPLLPAPP